MRKVLLATAAAFGLLAGTAEAGLLQINGGNAYSTPTVNNFSVGWAGRLNTSPRTPLSVVTTANDVQLTFEFLFRESGFTQNRFVLGAGGPGNEFISSDRTDLSTVGPFPTLSTTQASAGLIDFGFFSQANPTEENENGDAGIARKRIGPVTLWWEYGFYATTNDPFGPGKGNAVASGATGDIVWLAFDDGGARDDNHDDMIIKITASVRPPVGVPEPAALALMGAGLLGLGAMVRRRRKA